MRWLDLPDDEFVKLRKLIKDIEALELAGLEVSAEDAARIGCQGRGGARTAAARWARWTGAPPVAWRIWVRQL